MASETEYKVMMANGAVVTISGVDPDRIQKDGAGLRFYNNAGSAIAAFDDGQAKSYWPAAATVTMPDEPAPVINDEPAAEDNAEPGA